MTLIHGFAHLTRAFQKVTRIMTSSVLILFFLFLAAVPQQRVLSQQQLSIKQSALHQITVCDYGEVFSITSDTTWPSGNSYFLSRGCVVQVSNDATLTIEAGVVVTFDEGKAGIRVGGNLVVAGTSESPVIFDSVTGWFGLVIDTTGSAIIDHASIRKAGSPLYSNILMRPGGANRGAIDVTGQGELQLTNSEIINGGSTGIYLDGPNVQVSVHDSQIMNNHVIDPAHNPPAWAIYQSTINMKPDYHNLTFTGNDRDYVYIKIYDTITQDIAFGGARLFFESPFYPSPINIPAGTTLTIQPGAYINLENLSAQINILTGATLIANGTLEDPITLWKSGIRLYPGSSGQLSNCQIYGRKSIGSGPGNGLYIQTDGVNVSDCLIQDHTYEGVLVESPDSGSLVLRFQNVNVSNNGREGISLDSNSASTLTFNMQGGSISGNGYNGIGAYTSSSVLNLNLNNVLINGNGLSAGTNTALKNGIYSYARVKINLENSTITNNVGAAVQWYGNASLIARGNTASGNGSNAIEVFGHSTYSNQEWNLGDAGIPVRVLGQITVKSGAVLSIAPGSVLGFEAGAELNVQNGGSFYALGTAEKPIVFTRYTNGTYWRGLENESGSMLLDNCDISYSGYGSDAGVYTHGPGTNTVIQNSKIHDNGSDGIFDSTGTVVVRNNSFYNNIGYGVNAYYGTGYVDARRNWWGSPSGPTHTSNPSGTGDRITNRVDYDPWLTTEPESGGYSGELIVLNEIQENVSAGETMNYPIYYMNFMNTTVEDAVLMLQLPLEANYLESTHNGIYWPERHQVFWKLGSIEPGENDTVFAKVRFQWGLPRTFKGTSITLIAGSNYATDALDIDDYLNYVPRVAESVVRLSQTEFEALAAGTPDLQALYNLALSEGFSFKEAFEVSLSDGKVTSTAFMANSSYSVVRSVGIVNDQVFFLTSDSNTITFGDLENSRTVDLLSQQSEPIGNWSASAGLTNDSKSYVCDYSKCLSNCLWKYVGWETLLKAGGQTAAWLIGWKLSFGTVVAIPMLFWDAWQAGTAYNICKYECTNNPYTNCCIEGERIVQRVSTRQCKVQKCDTSNGYLYSVTENCLPVDQVCVSGFGSKAGCRNCYDDLINAYGPSYPKKEPVFQLNDPMAIITATRPTKCSELVNRYAKDPNAIYADPAGDFLPEETVNYRITCENEGDGRAYEVYIVNTLPEEFDAATLVINNGGKYLPEKRQLIWRIGELGPKGDPDSTAEVSYSAKLKAGLPVGTVVSNKAVVYFPSVPEETPTNTVTASIYPLAAVPQQVETNYMQPVDITLAGRPAGQPDMTYNITVPPLGGTLTGTPPNLTYTPVENFTGDDGFSFTVSNGTDTSLDALVSITVNTDGDLTAPFVTESLPTDNQANVPVAFAPLFQIEEGSVFAPVIWARFSEDVDETLLTQVNVQLKDSEGGIILTKAIYQPLLNQVVLYVLEPLAPNQTYQVVLGTGITDLSGNPLTDPYSWEFSTASYYSDWNQVFLPVISR